MASLFIMSESEPASPQEGKAWYKPSTAAVYKYINSSWIPWVGGSNLIDFDVGLNIFIRGVKRNEYIDNESFIKKDNLTHKVDTCKFNFWDDTSGQNIRPVQGDNVEVFWKSSANAVPSKIFGGETIIIPQTEQAPGANKYDYAVSCRDYSGRLNKLVVKSYENQTCKAIIQNLVALYATAFSTANVETGLTINFISWNYKTVAQCIKELAKLTGYSWYVDENKDIHFFASATNSAPHKITEDITTSGSYRDLKISVDKSQYRNRIFVQGGFYMSNDYTQIVEVQKNDQVEILIAYKPYAADSGAIEMYLDTGAGFGSKITPGIDNIDTTDDYVINQNAAILKDQNNLWNGGNVVKLIFKYKVPILTQDDDETSQENIRAIEGGDGIYEYRIADKNIKTIEAAHDRAISELNQFANPVIKGSYTTKDSGYRSGQLLPVDCPTRGYTNKTYLIQSAKTKVLVGNILEYDIVFATRLKGLTEFLANLYSGSSEQEIIVREGQILQTLKKLKKETLTMTDPDPRTDTDIPYQWQPGATRPFQWNVAPTTLDLTTFYWTG